MTETNQKYPTCFGILENVFPMAKSGFRETPESCMVCYYKTLCLRDAMKKEEGFAVREERVDRAYESGMIGFLERWSRKKVLAQKKNKKSET